jgi:hypothetical protein
VNGSVGKSQTTTKDDDEILKKKNFVPATGYRDAIDRLVRAILQNSMDRGIDRNARGWIVPITCFPTIIQWLFWLVAMSNIRRHRVLCMNDDVVVGYSYHDFDS